MNNLDKQKNRIIIFAVLLVIIGVANYFNYYAPPKPLEKIFSFSELSDAEKQKLFESSKNAKAVNNNTVEEDTVEQKAVNINELNNNYLNYAVDSNGKLVRWNKKNITVYVSPSEYQDTIYRALNEYNTYLGDFFKFYTVDKRGNADIKIDMVDRFESNNNPDSIYMAGITKNNFSGDEKYLNGSLIQILSIRPNSKRKVTKDEVYKVTLHELGHALGIIGHSPDENDVLYATSRMSTLSPRDIATLKIMYSNDKSIIQRETKNFAQTKLNEAINYAKGSPNKAISWVNLGRVYYDSGRKEDALNAYKKALEIEPNNPIIYQTMAECYYSSEKYDTAIKYYEITLNNIKNEEEKISIYNMIGMCYAKKEDFNKAYEYFNTAFSNDRNNKMLLKNYLVACVEIDKTTEAKNAISEFSVKHPDIMQEEFVKDVLKWAK
ncbi:tetratricopeptide repeat protein [bacterium]|nr:tetratricopeptide repeat protein [bacterium]